MSRQSETNEPAAPTEQAAFMGDAQGDAAAHLDTLDQALTTIHQADWGVHALFVQARFDSTLLFDAEWHAQTRQRLVALRQAILALDTLPPLPPVDTKLPSLITSLRAGYYAYMEVTLRALEVLVAERRAGIQMATRRLARASDHKAAVLVREQAVCVEATRLRALFALQISHELSRAPGSEACSAVVWGLQLAKTA